MLVEIGDLVVERVDVGGCAEPGFAPGLVAERLGQAFFELLDAGGEPESAVVALVGLSAVVTASKYPVPTSAWCRTAV